MPNAIRVRIFFFFFLEKQLELGFRTPDVALYNQWARLVFVGLEVQPM